MAKRAHQYPLFEALVAGMSMCIAMHTGRTPTRDRRRIGSLEQVDGDKRKFLQRSSVNLRQRSHVGNSEQLIDVWSLILEGIIAGCCTIAIASMSDCVRGKRHAL